MVQKKRKYPVSGRSVGEYAFVDGRGQRRMARVVGADRKATVNT